VTDHRLGYDVDPLNGFCYDGPYHHFLIDAACKSDFKDNELEMKIDIYYITMQDARWWRTY
jgi:hypothetical protein